MYYVKRNLVKIDTKFDLLCSHVHKKAKRSKHIFGLETLETRLTIKPLAHAALNILYFLQAEQDAQLSYSRESFSNTINKAS